jgi:hypothetical protein
VDGPGSFSITHPIAVGLATPTYSTPLIPARPNRYHSGHGHARVSHNRGPNPDGRVPYRRLRGGYSADPGAIVWAR